MFDNPTSSGGAPSPAFYVVRNDEEQYSIWPEGRQVPAGWQPIGASATKDACLERIRVEWTDLRPKSIREAGRG